MFKVFILRWFKNKIHWYKDPSLLNWLLLLNTGTTMICNDYTSDILCIANVCENLLRSFVNQSSIPLNHLKERSEGSSQFHPYYQSASMPNNIVIVSSPEDTFKLIYHLLVCCWNAKKLIVLCTQLCGVLQYLCSVWTLPVANPGFPRGIGRQTIIWQNVAEMYVLITAKPQIPSTHSQNCLLLFQCWE